MKWKLRRWRKRAATIYPTYIWWLFPWNVITWLFLHGPGTQRYLCLAFRDSSVHTLRNKALSQEYFTLLCDALDLLRDSDPRRFHLVQREICYVVNQWTLGHGATYCHLFRQCLIQLESYVPDTLAEVSEQEYCWHVAVVASTLVHEATHGRIKRYHWGYGRHDWQRIERLCRKQQQYFAERVADDTYDYARDLVPPLDVAWYETHFDKTKEERRAEAKLILQKVCEAWRK